MPRWRRATWHECVDELDEECQRFRDALRRHHGQTSPRPDADTATMEEASRAGMQILLSLARAGRSEYDLGIAAWARVVGAYKPKYAEPSDAILVKQSRGSGFRAVLDCEGWE